MTRHMQNFGTALRNLFDGSATLPRVALFCGALGTAGTARGSVTELIDKLAEIAGQFPTAPGASRQDQERRLILNGQVLHLVTGRTQAPVEQTLDFYRQQFDARARRPKTGLRMLGIKSGDAKAGYVVMVDPDSRDSLLAVAQNELPLPAAGPLRMVYAQRRGDATDYLVSWTDRALPAGVLRPSLSQDAPGQDIPGIPRPANGVRSLNIFEPAAGYGLVSYRLESPIEQALQSTKDQLRAAGFQEDPTLRRAADSLASSMTQLGRRDDAVLLSGRSHPTQGSEITYLWRVR